MKYQVEDLLVFHVGLCFQKNAADVDTVLGATVVRAWLVLCSTIKASNA